MKSFYFISGESNLEWYLKVLQNYANFNGRARRKEYWMFQLFNSIIIIALYFLGLVVSGIFIGLYVLYALAILIPSLAVTVRRLHDIGKSGWWYFICLVPIIGGIWLLILTCTEGTRGSNAYGLDPKDSQMQMY